MSAPSDKRRWRNWIGSGEMPPGMIKFFTRLLLVLGGLAFLGVILALINAFVFHQA